MGSTNPLHSTELTDQAKSTSSLTKKFEEIEAERIKKENYSGGRISAGEAVSASRGKSIPPASQCPPGSVQRKSDDVRHYLVSQEKLQAALGLSIERFTSKQLTRNQAIAELNSLINESNKIIEWGYGKVTNGACGPAAVTELIQESIGSTKTLISQYKTSLEPRKQ